VSPLSAAGGVTTAVADAAGVVATISTAADVSAKENPAELNKTNKMKICKNGFIIFPYAY
jgi:hypothetical protein